MATSKQQASQGHEIAILDPSIGSPNTGDAIIRDSIVVALEHLGFAKEDVSWLPTQRPLTFDEIRLARNARLLLVGGTNLLSSNMPFYRQWKIGPKELLSMRGRVVLAGVGWWQYQGPPNAFTKRVLQLLLSRHLSHSVRDSMTKSNLEKTGRASTMTSCPTLWGLSDRPEHGTTKSKRVVLTLTDYNRKPELDKKLLDLTHTNYESVSVWPQGRGDHAYLRDLGYEGRVLEPTLTAFNELLAEGRTDYIGTRLHAGIRALQFGARASIVAIDNRASEIAKDTQLPVVSRRLTESDEAFLLDERKVELTLPRQAIAEWKSRLKHEMSG